MTLFTFTLLVSSARAQTAPAEGEALRLVVRAPREVIDAEGLRAALARELDAAVELGDPLDRARVEVEARPDARMRVAVLRPGRREVAREIALPASQASETLALLAANLLRDEASELLRELRPLEAARRPPPTPDGCAPWHGRKAWIGADFVPYLGTSSVHGSDVERAFSFNAIGGITGSMRGFELGGAFNLATRALCGVQLSGAANIVGGPASGTQVSLVNVAAGRVDGLQLGLVEVAAGELYGAQVGLVNLATGPARGLQFGLASVASDGLDGVQLGLVNVTAREAAGLQLGQVNVAQGGLRGGQIGLLNISDQEVRGMMFGLVNIARKADAAIGLATILSEGRTQLELWGTDAGLVMAGVSHGGDVIHNLYAVGVTHRSEFGAMPAAALGLGVRLADGERLQLDVDALAYLLLARDDADDRFVTGSILQLRVPIAWRVTPQFALYLAPALNLSIGERGESLHDPGLYESARLTSASDNTEVRMWPGLCVGLRLF